MRRALPLAAALAVAVSGSVAAAASGRPARSGADSAKRSREQCARTKGPAARGRRHRCARWSQARAGAAGAAGTAGYSELATVGSPSNVPPGSGTGSSPPSSPLPRRLAVDENEYTVFPSRNPVGAGDLEFNVNNFGQDDHDLTITNGTNQFGQVFVAAGTSEILTATLPAGTYKLYCSLLNGLHDGYGMHATLTVQ
jgi:plastocyanin